MDSAAQETKDSTTLSTQPCSLYNRPPVQPPSRSASRTLYAPKSCYSLGMFHRGMASQTEPSRMDTFCVTDQRNAAYSAQPDLVLLALRYLQKDSSTCGTALRQPCRYRWSILSCGYSNDESNLSMLGFGSAAVIRTTTWVTKVYVYMQSPLRPRTLCLPPLV